MTKKEILKQLKEKGVEKIWGRGITTRTKAELLEYLNHCENVDGKVYRHMSASQLNGYLECGLSYYFKRIDEKAPRAEPKTYFQYGRAYHEGVALGLEEKRILEKEPNIPSMKDAFFDAMNIDEGVDWDSDEKAFCEHQGLGLVEVYGQNIIPTLVPMAVEENSYIRFTNREWSVMVIPDLEAEHGDRCIIVDHKTCKATPPLTEADSNDQLTVYALGYKAKYGILPDGVELHKAVSLKRAPKKESMPRYAAHAKTKKGFVGIVPVKSTRTEKQIERYLKTMELAVRMIKAGFFPPSSTMNWKCKPTACDYWDYCHKEW